MLRILSGSLKGQKILTPKDIRPATSTVRDAIFNIVSSQIEDANFLDLFSGSGAIGLEAISRGAKFATFVDKSPVSVRFIKKNIKNLNLEAFAKVIPLDVNLALKRLPGIFDIVTIDPPFIIYEKNPLYINNTLTYLITQNLIDKNSCIFLEEPTYSKRDPSIEGFFFKNKRKYGSCYLLEYFLK
ncbi:MAG: Ribosomal RNA small subunit methyltransferase D [Candidatus Anoxychlamydiales bacterium]|nr:Ribosomal RNA small subunit methyltransferase D [Candidatus Anoxychlamydiales bacterium]NGX35205.1 Ribosomal RNA small subunit methyltransferase D [Candidatus Anoxychlamydiales bacterium]